MLYYDRIDFSEGIDVNKTSESKECDIWYFLDKRYKFQPDVSKVCHDLLMMSINLRDIAILNIHDVDYCCIINGISKSEAINLLQKADFIKKWNILNYKKIIKYI